MATINSAEYLTGVHRTLLLPYADSNIYTHASVVREVALILYNRNSP